MIMAGTVARERGRGCQYYDGRGTYVFVKVTVASSKAGERHRIS